MTLKRITTTNQQVGKYFTIYPPDCANNSRPALIFDGHGHRGEGELAEQQSDRQEDSGTSWAEGSVLSPLARKPSYRIKRHICGPGVL